MINKEDIKFFVPVDFEKGKDKSGNEIMKVKGIASTSDRDSQGEELDISGYDLSQFTQIDWNHKGKSDASAVIGEPTMARIENNSLLIEGLLYPEVPMAKSVWNLMKARKNSKNKLGFSVEGKVLERGHIDPKNPLYNKIKKAKITSVAICPHPINSNTLCEAIEKGFTNNDWKFDEETEVLMKSFESGDFNEIDKAFSVEGNQKLVQEDVEGKKNKKKPELTIDDEEIEENKITLSKKLSKADVYEKIFSYFYDVDINKAQSIYNLIEKLATMSTENKEITEETINKAFSILENTEDAIIKGGKEKAEKEKDEDDEDEKEEDEMMEKAKAATKSYMDKGLEKAEVVSKMIKKGYNEALINKAYDSFSGEKVEKSQNNTELLKSIQDVSDNINSKFSAMADIFKSQNNQIVDLQDNLTEATTLLKKSEETVTLLGETLAAMAKTPGQRKSVTSFTDKHFGEEGIQKSENGAKIYDLKNNTSRKELINHLTELSDIRKGGKFDEELVQIAQGIEIAKSIETKSLSRLKALNIEVIS